MRHVTAFLVKLVATIAAMYFVALFFPLWGTMTFWHTVVLGLFVSIIGYITDLYIPQAFNSIAAVYVDFAVTLIVTYFGNFALWGMSVSWTFALFVALLVAGVEIFYHFKFVRRSM